MIQEDRHIQPDFQVIDERFEVGQIVDSTLVIETAPYFLRMAIKDEKGVFRILENYPVNSRWPDPDFLEDLFNNHPFLSARFWKEIKWLIHSEAKTRVPANLSQEKGAELLQVLTAHFTEEDHAQIHDLKDTRLVYAFQTALHDFLSSFYNEKEIELVPADAELPGNFRNPVLVFYLNGYGYYEAENSYFSRRIENIYELLNKENLVYVFGEVTQYDRAFRELEHEFRVSLGTGKASSLKLSQYFLDAPLHRYHCILSQ